MQVAAGGRRVCKGLELQIKVRFLSYVWRPNLAIEGAAIVLRVFSSELADDERMHSKLTYNKTGQVHDVSSY
jgi:hypothetical protein